MDAGQRPTALLHSCDDAILPMTCMDGCLGAMPKTHAVLAKRTSPKAGHPTAGHFRTSHNLCRPERACSFAALCRNCTNSFLPQKGRFAIFAAWNMSSRDCSPNEPN